MELCKFDKSKARYITEGACCIENLVLICENHIPRINFRVGVIDSFIPAQDGIQKIPIVYYVTNGKASEIRCQINTLYSIDNRQRKKAEVQLKFIDERNITNI